MKKSILLIALLLGIMSSAKADDGITISTYGNATGNTTRTMTLIVKHETNNYVAFQMDLTLPEGTTIDPTAIVAKAPMKDGGSVTISGTEYDTNFKFDGATQTDGTYRVIGYNMGNDALAGTSGDICLTIPLTTTTGVAYDLATVSAKNIIFVESAGLTGVDMTAVDSDYRLWGDVVKDGVIDSKDYQTLANIIASKTYDSTADKFAADMNMDDTYDGKDYQSLANKIAGK